MISEIAPALRACGFVGAWTWNATSGAVVLDRGSADLIAGDAGLAGRALTLEAALSGLHPADQGWVMQRIAEVGHRGGPIAMDYRVRRPSGEVRWLHGRGSLEATPEGILLGHGLLLDITASRAASEESDPPNHALRLATDHCIRARDLLQREGSSALRLMIDVLLVELGRELARAGDLH